MSTYYSPKIVTDGLVVCLDAANSKGISALGCGGFTGSAQLVKNMVSPSDVIGDFGGVRLGNLTYYTAFAIDYPEYSFGGDAASRQGITPGYNVRSGTKTYDASRALHLYAWNNATSAWIEGEFNGARFSGHCYDNYTGAETGYAAELAKFVTDYNNIKTKYPDVSFVVIGSHRADRYSQAVRDILTDLGKPAGYIDSDYIAAPEWILIGKPGLGAGNYYGWAYENYATNPSQVAHLNFGLPIFGSKDNYFLFDGVDDYFSSYSILDSFWNAGSWTANVWVKFATVSKGLDNAVFGHGSYGPTNNGLHLGERNSRVYFGFYSNDTSGNIALSANTWYNIAWVFNYSTKLKQIYVNGVFDTSGGTVGYGGTGTNTEIGRYPWAPSYLMSGNIAIVSLYNKVLSASEVLQNYNAMKPRFSL